MRCANCQAELDPGEVFCGDCGQPVKSASVPMPAPASAPANSGLWKYAFIFLVALIAAGALYFKGAVPAVLLDKFGLKPSPTVTVQSSPATRLPSVSPSLKATPQATIVTHTEPQILTTASPKASATTPKRIPVDEPPAQIIQPWNPQNQAWAVIHDPDGFTNVRAGPGTSFPIKARVVEGEPFMVTVSNNKWWKVITKDGVEGYMHRSRIRIIQQ